MSNRTPFAALVALALLPATVQAQDGCFTPRDLGRGVEVLFEAGDVYTIRRLGTGKLALIEDYADSRQPIRFEGAHALYLESEVELVDGQPDPTTRLLVEFPEDTLDLPLPAPNTSFSRNTTNIFADGFRRPEVWTATFGDLGEITLSGCTYQMIPTTLRYDWPESSDGMTVSYSYLPEIGFAFLMTRQFAGQEPQRNIPIGLRRASK